MTQPKDPAKDLMESADIKKQFQSYIEAIEEITRQDYGDFKRKVGMYINSLQEICQDSRLEKLKTFVLYTFDGDVDEAQEEVLERLKAIEKSL